MGDNPLNKLDAKIATMNAIRTQAAVPTVVPTKLAQRFAQKAIDDATPPVPKIAFSTSLDAKTHAAMSAREQIIKEIIESEVTRILSMPIREDMTADELEAYSQANTLGEAFESGFRFLPPQGNALLAFDLTGRGFHPIGVGWGKTLLTIGIAQRHFERGYRKGILLVPPEILGQLVHDIKWARTKIPVSVPFHVLGGRSVESRAALARSGRDGCYIFPYSLFSTRDTDEILNAISPSYVIADEAQKLARRSAARTKRIMRYLDDRPDVSFVCMSGTITSKTVGDYLHLIRRSLAELNPLPNHTEQANEWAEMIDAEAVPGEKAGAIEPLWIWARKNFPLEDVTCNLKGFRKAYKLRLKSCPGVVSSGDSDIGVSLILHNEPVLGGTEEGYTELKGLMEEVDDNWTTPNGDDIDFAIHKWKWLNELTAGFYNRLYWPSAAQLAVKRQISESEAGELLERALDHHVALQAYHKELRSWLDHKAKPGLDTPMLVAASMARDGAKNVGVELFTAWSTAKKKEFEGMPERLSESVLVCRYKIKAAVDWAKRLPKGEGGIIWLHHQSLGEWTYKALIEAGINAVHCPAGANEKVLDKANVDKVLVCSMTAHGVGKNLQHHRNQYVMQWPRPARDAEQFLGRTHRTGQTADELLVFTNLSHHFDHQNFAACLNDAVYIHTTTGNRQKLVYAVYDPLPKIWSPEALRSKGMEPEILSAEQRTTLQEKFGDYLK